MPVSVTARRATKGVESPPPRVAAVPPCGRWARAPRARTRRGMPRAALPILLAAAVLAAAPASASRPGRAGLLGRSPTACRPGSTATGTTRGLYTGFSAGAHADVLLDPRGRRRSATTTAPRATTARARRIVDALVDSPPFVATSRRRARGTPRSHAPGFVASMHLASAPTSTSSSTARSSTACATRGSPAASSASPTRRRTRSPTASTAPRSARFWRWPTIRLNQINWYALVYAANATVTGSPRLLRHDLRLQIERFAARARGSRAAPPATSAPGLRFNYLPHMRPGAR